MRKLLYFFVFLLITVIGVEIYLFLSLSRSKTNFSSLNHSVPTSTSSPQKNAIETIPSNVDAPQYLSFIAMINKNIELAHDGILIDSTTEFTYEYVISYIDMSLSRFVIKNGANEKTHQVTFSPEELKVLKVYDQTENGLVPISLSDLKVKDNVRYHSKTKNMFRLDYEISEITIMRLKK